MLKHTPTILLLALAILHSPFFIPHSACAAGKLPDTGQTKCYQAVSPYAEIPCAGTGQDGAYSINPMSFTDNGNGTITDNNTGLVWQKCSMGQNSTDCSGTAATYNWYQATGTYDASYNASSVNVCGSLSLAGTGWRLPSKKELVGIVDYSIPYPGPTIPQAIFPGTVSSSYWSSTTNAYNTSYAWHVYFLAGDVVFTIADEDFDILKSNTYYVRCVRGGQ
ncbi:Protein of unknown function [Trichlorobacter thiogenes]|uniref:Lcl C-terminal domain-containing protein n=1 Tax=Trichlorobacter thiogenes TaxID=115783 RepID=A0A1T4QRD7_9BACT|nr:DUF1566 domain-containing protein [Trichlorobacter thiogenes]SKA06322.1 Protein of unknown function [Trichlorobacter thiogenes]